MIGVLDIKRDIANAVTMLLDVLSGRMIRRERRRQNKVNIVLPHQVARRLTITGLKSGISVTRKSERLAVIKLRLLGIADVKLDVVYFLQS